MAFSKNWKQLIVSKGEPFQIEYLDRKFNGRPRVVFKIDDTTGTVQVNGVDLTGNQNIAGDLVVTGDVSSATLETSGNADVGGTLGVDGAVTLDGNATVGGTLGVTGVATFTGQARLPASSFLVAVHAGVAAPGPVTLTGAKVGDLVIGVANVTTPGDLKAGFETTITVNDQIQQSSATDLHLAQIQFMLLRHS